MYSYCILILILFLLLGCCIYPLYRIVDEGRSDGNIPVGRVEITITTIILIIRKGECFLRDINKLVERGIHVPVKGARIRIEFLHLHLLPIAGLVIVLIVLPLVFGILLLLLLSFDCPSNTIRIYAK